MGVLLFCSIWFSSSRICIGKYIRLKKHQQDNIILPAQSLLLGTWKVRDGKYVSSLPVVDMVGHVLYLNFMNHKGISLNVGGMLSKFQKSWSCIRFRIIVFLIPPCLWIPPCATAEKFAALIRIPWLFLSFLALVENFLSAFIAHFIWKLILRMAQSQVIQIYATLLQST